VTRVRTANILIASVVASATVIAAPAFAGDATCLWNQVPQADRDAFLARTENEPTAQMEDITDMFARADVNAIFHSCGATDATSKDAVWALIGYAFVEASIRRLEHLHAADRAQLDRGWMTMDPNARKTLVDSVNDPEHREPPKSVMLDFLDHAGLKDKPAVDPTTGQTLIAYMYGRSVVAAHEPKF
jgi:hypothetical protein